MSLKKDDKNFVKICKKLNKLKNNKKALKSPKRIDKWEIEFISATDTYKCRKKKLKNKRLKKSQKKSFKKLKSTTHTLNKISCHKTTKIKTIKKIVTKKLKMNKK